MKVAHPLIAIGQVTAIKREREQLRESRRRSYDELARILNTFDTSFPDAIPNDSTDFDERVHDYVALCQHIDERELPEAYERMMRLVTEQAPDAILTLHRVAEQRPAPSPRGGQDDLGIHHAAPRNARDGGTDASHGLMSTTASSPLIATDARNGAPSRSCTTASRRS
jgi:hypothetical protein